MREFMLTDEQVFTNITSISAINIQFLFNK